MLHVVRGDNGEVTVSSGDGHSVRIEDAGSGLWVTHIQGTCVEGGNLDGRSRAAVADADLNGEEAKSGGFNAKLAAEQAAQRDKEEFLEWLRGEIGYLRSHSHESISII